MPSTIQWSWLLPTAFSQTVRKGQPGCRRGSNMVAHRRYLLLEALEPKVVLAAQPLLFAADTSVNLTLQLNGDTVQIVENSDNDSPTVVAERILSATSEVVITGSSFDDRLTVLFDSGSALENLSISFDGGIGNDSLFGPSPDSVWNITGANLGSVGRISFGNTEFLNGADSNEDSFVFGASGTLSGIVDGGAGGFDSVVFSGGEFDTVVYAATSADSGTIERDGDVITYVGMEPVTAGSLVAANVVFDGTLIADQVTLKRAPSGNLLLESDNDLSTFESVEFADPAGSLTINLGFNAVLTDEHVYVEELGRFAADLTINGQGGSDTVVFKGDLDLAGHTLTVDAESITVQDGVVISTRMVALGENPRTAASIGASGDIFFDAKARSDEEVGAIIDIGDNARLLAHTSYALQNVSVPTTAWTANQLFTGVAPASTSGIGTGQRVNITTDGGGTPSVTLVAPGSGYTEGEIVSFSPPGGVGTVINATVRYAYAAGDITLAADNFAGFAGLLVARIKESSATVDIGAGAEVKGGIVEISGISDNSRLFDETSGLAETTIEFLESLTSLAGVAISTADANVTVASGAVVEAGSLTITADAIARAQVRAVGTAIGVVYATSDSTANVDIHTGARLVSLGDVTLASDAESEVDASAITASLARERRVRRRMQVSRSPMRRSIRRLRSHPGRLSGPAVMSV